MPPSKEEINLLKTLIKQQEEMVSLLKTIHSEIRSSKLQTQESDTDLNWNKLMELGKHQKQTYNMIRRIFSEKEFTTEELTREIVGKKPSEVEQNQWEKEIRSKHYPRIARHVKDLASAGLLSVRQAVPEKGEHISQKYYSISKT